MGSGSSSWALELGWEDIKVGKTVRNLDMDKEIGTEKHLGMAGEKWML